MGGRLCRAFMSFPGLALDFAFEIFFAKKAGGLSEFIFGASKY